MKTHAMESKMTGWIIYSKEDVEKNKHYIHMYEEKFKEYDVTVKLAVINSQREPDRIIFFDYPDEPGDFTHFDYLEQSKLPDFAINRSRNAKVAEKLEKAGVRVFNSSKVTEIANNKGKTYEFLKDTVPFLSVKYGKYTIVSQIDGEHFKYPYIIKSCSGHGGSQVFLVNDIQQEKDAIESIKKSGKNNEYIVQQCCSDLGKDVRVYIIGNKIIKAVLRTSTESFKSNYSLGGSVEEYKLNSREQDMVNAIVKKLPLDYAGIDFTFHNGMAVFNEIEDAVGARMLYKVSDIDIVQQYVDYIIKVLR